MVTIEIIKVYYKSTVQNLHQRSQIQASSWKWKLLSL